MENQANTTIGQAYVTVNLAPRSRIAYEIRIDWFGIPTRGKLLGGAIWVKRLVEKELGGVKLADMVFEIDKHVCDKATWENGTGGVVRSWTAFGPIRISIVASANYIMLRVVDKAVEALVEKERKENPLTFDSKAEKEAERRRFERLKELSRQRKAMKDAQKAKPPRP